MNKLFLHIGMGKTGTSAIQYFLYENREMLLKQNILYPITENYFIDKDNDVTSGNANEIIKLILAEEYEKIFEYLESLLKENNVLISSEILIYYFGKNIDLFYDIVEQFNATVILYIRKQDEYYNSLANQWTKLKSLVDADCLKEVHENYFYIMKIVNSINTEKLIIRPYEKDQFKNRNLIDNFLECLGLELDTNYKMNARNINNSLSPICYKIKQEYNRTYGDVTNKEFINVLIEYSKRESNFKKVFIITKKEREELLELYNDFNMSLAIRFMQRLDGVLFYDGINDKDVYIDDERLFADELLDSGLEFIKSSYKGNDIDLDKLFIRAFK